MSYSDPWEADDGGDWKARGAEPTHIGDGECIAETPKAILVRLAGTSFERWIPKSQLHDDSEVFEKGGKGRVIVKLWFAEKEGWA